MKSEGLQARGDRRVYIDFVKIIAIFMVVYNHTGKKGFYLFTAKRASALFPLYLSVSVLIKVAVPLFFMASGALLLGRQEPLATVVKKRFCRFLVTLTVASLALYIYECLRKAQPFSALAFLTRLYSDPIVTPYWYLYRFLAYLLMLPLLRKLAATLEKREYNYLVILFALVKALQIAEYLIWRGKVAHYEKLMLFTKIDYVFYPLMGYCIDAKTGGENVRRHLIGLACAAVAAVAVTGLLTVHRCRALHNWGSDNAQAFFNTLIFLPSLCLFYAARQWFAAHRPSERMIRCLAGLSGMTFGIYLLESAGRKQLVFVYDVLLPLVKPFPAGWIYVLATVVACGCVVWLLKRVPFLRKYL